jgi:hypothetical protein
VTSAAVENRGNFAIGYGVLWAIAPAILVCVVSGRSSRLRPYLDAALGAAVAALFAVRLPAWIVAAVSLASAYLTTASLDGWRGTRRFRATALALALALAPATVVAAAALTMGSWGAFAGALRVAMPTAPVSALATDVLVAVVIVLASDGVRPRGRAPRALRWGLVAGTILLLLARGTWIAGMATLSLETGWAEAPALVNALKLDAHEPLYGPPDRLDSYTYSPLLDLLHHALLAPLRLELSLGAHRTLALLEQLVAGAVLAWSLGPTLARAGWRWSWIAPALSLLVLVNMLAASVHPDHLLLVAFAVAVALLVAESRWNRRLWWVALLLLAPFAAAAKLTGAGIGVALAVAFAAERRWVELGACLASLAAAAATVPLFQATLGAYRFYAIDVQRSHAIEWHKLPTLPATAPGLVALGAAALVASIAWIERSSARRREPELRRLALLTVVTTVASLPAWIKYAGNNNNLTLLAVGATCTGMLCIAQHVGRGGATLHPWLGPAAILLGLSKLVPPQPWPSDVREMARHDAVLIEQTLRADEAAGQRTLVSASVVSWIASGRRDVPPDRAQSAVELALGGFPQAELFFSHIEDGRYESILVRGPHLIGAAGPAGAFQDRLRRTIESHYAVVGPLGAPSVEAHSGFLVFRRIR